MSRIGKQPITIPAGVEVKVDKEKSVVTVKGKKGELSQHIKGNLALEINDGTLELKRNSETQQDRAFHGLYRSILNNMITGVSEGFVKKMELIGVGYRATATGQVLELAVGYSHPVVFLIPKEIKVSADMQKGQPPIVTLESIDNQLLGLMCAQIRKVRKPEPYKGKGIKFVNEVIRRKAGKAASKK
jgi:large subunit ribosomal protein L6